MERNACLYLNKLTDANAVSWASPLHLSNVFPWSEFIPHPLTYVSIDLPVIQRSLLQTMRKLDTLFLFSLALFPSLIHLFEGLSVARRQTQCLLFNNYSYLWRV